jgi:excinuclease ABC subunit B
VDLDLDLTETVMELEEEMLGAANNLEFEKAALLRDQIRELKRALDGTAPKPGICPAPTVSYRKSKRGQRLAK